MARLNQEREERLQPLRMDHAKKKLEAMGYEVKECGDCEIQFKHKGSIVKFYPYSGWATGATIKDGRGLDNLLKQLNPQQQTK